MPNLLQLHINKRIHLTAKEFAACEKFFTRRNMKKRQYLLQEGDVCRHLAFVESGCLREYSVDHKGEEHTLQFAIADWWIADIESFLTGRPATTNIVTVQDSTLLLLEKQAREELLAAVPRMERFYRLLLENRFVAAQARIVEALSASAEERYLSFLKTYPALIEQIPQNQIASYLGITPQSLSRIRRELTQKRLP